MVVRGWSWSTCEARHALCWWRGAHRRGRAERRGTCCRARPSSGQRRQTSAGRRGTWPRPGGTTASLLARSSPAIAAGATAVRASRGAATPAVPPAVDMARVGEGGREADGTSRAHGKRHSQRPGGRGGLPIDATAVPCPSALGGQPTPAAGSSQAGSAKEARTTHVLPSAASRTQHSSPGCCRANPPTGAPWRS